MSKYRNQLPQLDGKVFLTDSGLETTLIFHDGYHLPEFAGFDIMRDQKGRDRLREYFVEHAAIALERDMGFVLETPTWRASTDWGARIGYSPEALEQVNRECVEQMENIRAELETETSPMVVSGQIGPRGDGYVPAEIMSPEEAQAYHAVQIGTFADTAADMVSAFTMTNVEEAIGVTRAGQAMDIPVMISFTTETDGRLPTGQMLKSAIEAVDAATGNGPVYYMINCAHPTHFADALAPGEAWMERVRGLQANASKRSHAELDEAPDLDAGNPVELAGEYGELARRHGKFSVFGGCCGTDHRHLAKIGDAVKAVG